MKKKHTGKKKIVHRMPEAKTAPLFTDTESRRKFLKKVWKGLGIIAVFEFTAVFFGFLFSEKQDRAKAEPKHLMEAGPVDSFQKNSVTVFRGGRFYLVRLEDGGFIALSLRCTHLGCSINWEEDKRRFICPCHSSAFYMNGDVQNPPAPAALDYFPVTITNGVVKVDTGSKLTRTRFEKSQAAYL
jgi:cytochrome b6-f complex iron-sulfur subunit